MPSIVRRFYSGESDRAQQAAHGPDFDYCPGVAKCYTAPTRLSRKLLKTKAWLRLQLRYNVRPRPPYRGDRDNNFT